MPKTKKSPEITTTNYTLGFEYCNDQKQDMEQDPDRGVNYFNQYSQMMKAEADSDEDMHLVSVTLSDPKGKVLNQNKVQCRHQKPQ